MGMLQVTFASYGDKIASSRLRAQIPQQELFKLGIKQGRDILVYGKHLVSMEQVSKFKLAVYDICDDHFNGYYAEYYHEHASKADLVTCNSEAMREIIKHHTGRLATVIPDPYESAEQPAGIGKGILWFGHQSNLVDLEPYLNLKPEILTGDEWSRERQDTMLKDCAVVIIPTGKSMAKSANRLMDVSRNGRFVVGGELPSHDEFKQLMFIGDIREGLAWFDSNQAEAIERVTECQRYIKHKYSPEAISRLWLASLETLWQSTHLEL